MRLYGTSQMAVVALAAISGQAFANSVTAPLAAAATVAARGVATSEATASTLVPPSSPEMRVATTTVRAAADFTALPVPEITALADGIDAVNEAFVQTTYYSCVTRGTYSHCGWHIPILDVSGAYSTREAGIAWKASAAAAVMAAVLAFG